MPGATMPPGDVLNQLHQLNRALTQSRANVATIGEDVPGYLETGGSYTVIVYNPNEMRMRSVGLLIRARGFSIPEPVLPMRRSQHAKPAELSAKK